MDKLIMQRIGKRIRKGRKAIGITQAQLAEKFGQDRATITNYELGRFGPHITELPLLAEILQVEINFFFDFSDDASLPD